MLRYLVPLVLQLQIPSPVGYVNDFAGVLDGQSQRQMLAVIEEVRRKSGGEIVVVTLADLAGREPIDVARDIGREWGVGARGEGPGDRTRNAGVVLLLKPGERPGDGKADLAIATGYGAEGFVTDARSGRIRDAIGELSVSQSSYAAGLVAGVWLLAQAYAEEFGFELTGQPPVELPPEGSSGGLGALVIFAIFMVFFIINGAARARMYGGRRSGSSLLGWILLSMLMSGGRRGGGWHGGGFGGGGFGGGGI